MHRVVHDRLGRVGIQDRIEETNRGLHIGPVIERDARLVVDVPADEQSSLQSTFIELTDSETILPGFVDLPIEIALAPEGSGPIALHSGHFNRNDRLDFAVVNNLNSTVMILLSA